MCTKKYIEQNIYIYMSQVYQSDPPVNDAVVSLRVKDLDNLSDGNSVTAWGSITYSGSITYRNDGTSFPYVQLGGGYLNLGQQTMVPSQGFTYTGLVYTTATNVVYPLVWSYATARDDGLRLYRTGSGDTLSFRAQDAGNIDVKKAGINTVNTWQVFTCRATNNGDSTVTMELIIDGVVQATETAAVSSIEGITDGLLQVGNSTAWTGQPNSPIHISDSFFYDRALSNTELQDMYTYLTTMSGDASVTYNKVTITTIDNKELNFAEFQLFNTADENIALLGTASQTSTQFAEDGQASNGIDGNTDGNFDHTNSSAVPIVHTGSGGVWTLTLDRSYTLSELSKAVLYNRTSGSVGEPQRFIGAPMTLISDNGGQDVLIGTGTDEAVQEFVMTELVEEETEATLQPILAYSLNNTSLGADSSGSGLDATVNDVTLVTDPEKGSVASFNNPVSTLVLSSGSVPSSLVGTGPRTFSCWINYSVGPNNMVLFRNGVDSPVRSRLRAMLQPDGTIKIDVGGYNVVGSGVLASDTWYHLAFVFDGTSYRAYIDGTPDAFFENPEVSVAVGDFIIGDDESTSSIDGGYAGLMTDFKVYDKALSQVEIAQLSGTISQEEPAEPTYDKVIIRPPANVYNQIAEFQLYGQSGTNIAMLGTAYQSATWQLATADNAIDGDLEAEYTWDDGAQSPVAIANPGVDWVLTLDKGYSLSELSKAVFYNRSSDSYRADGVTILLTSSTGLPDYLIGTCTADLVQEFTISRVFGVTPGAFSVEVSVPVVEGATSLKLTYEKVGTGNEKVAHSDFTDEETPLTITNLSPETPYKISLYNALTLVDSAEVTTLVVSAGNVNKNAFLKGDKFDLASADMAELSSVMNELFTTGNEIDVSVVPGRSLTAKFVKRGDTVEVQEDNLLLPFDPDSGSGQEVSLSSSDGSVVTVQYDGVSDNITVGDNTYADGDSFLLDNKKITVYNV